MTNSEVILALMTPSYHQLATNVIDEIPNTTLTFTTPDISQVHAQILHRTLPILFIDPEEASPGIMPVYQEVWQEVQKSQGWTLLATLLDQTQLPISHLHLVTPTEIRHAQANIAQSTLAAHNLPLENIHRIKAGDSPDSLAHVIMGVLSQV